VGTLKLKSQHRILCGDATSAEAVERLMDGQKVDCVFTSPPYAQQRDYNIGNISDWDKLMNGVTDAILGICSEGTQIFVNLGKVHKDNEVVEYYSDWIKYCRSTGLRYFGLYVWDKLNGMMGDWNGRFAPSFEFIYHFNRQALHPNKTVEKKAASIKDKTGSPGLRNKDGSIGILTSPLASLQTHKIPDDVIRMNNSSCQGEHFGHPASFPVSLPLFFLEAYTSPSESVYEPFCGSGTTLIAAQTLERRCFGMELDPIYADVIVKRWEQYSGKKAVRQCLNS